MEQLSIIGGALVAETQSVMIDTGTDAARANISCLLAAQMQIKLLHLGAVSYNEHLIIGDLYATLEPLVDEYCELSLSDKLRSEVNGAYTLNFTVDAKVAVSIIQQHAQCLTQFPADRRDINAVVDQMIAACKRAEYLLTF